MQLSLSALFKVWPALANSFKVKISHSSIDQRFFYKMIKAHHKAGVRCTVQSCLVIGVISE